MAKPAFRGFVADTQDALLILEGCRRGILPRTTDRLTDAERKSISSGDIFVFSEEQSRIKRWTDGRRWSPSRILNNFLIYKEIPGNATEGEEAPDDSNDRPAAGNAIVQPERAELFSPPATPVVPGSSLFAVPEAPTREESDAYSTSSSVSTFGQARPDDEAAKDTSTKVQRALRGSLTATGSFRDGGLMKKAISVAGQHMITYYSAEDVSSGRLICPTSVPELASLEISNIFLSASYFRHPPVVETLEDGAVRFLRVTDDEPMARKPNAQTKRPRSDSSARREVIAKSAAAQSIYARPQTASAARSQPQEAHTPLVRESHSHPAQTVSELASPHDLSIYDPSHSTMSHDMGHPASNASQSLASGLPGQPAEQSGEHYTGYTSTGYSHTLPYAIPATFSPKSTDSCSGLARSVTAYSSTSGQSELSPVTTHREPLRRRPSSARHEPYSLPSGRQTTFSSRPTSQSAVQTFSGAVEMPASYSSVPDFQAGSQQPHYHTPLYRPLPLHYDYSAQPPRALPYDGSEAAGSHGVEGRYRSASFSHAGVTAILPFSVSSVSQQPARRYSGYVAPTGLCDVLELPMGPAVKGTSRPSTSPPEYPPYSMPLGGSLDFPYPGTSYPTTTDGTAYGSAAPIASSLHYGYPTYSYYQRPATEYSAPQWSYDPYASTSQVYPDSMYAPDTGVSHQPETEMSMEAYQSPYIPSLPQPPQYRDSAAYPVHQTTGSMAYTTDYSSMTPVLPSVPMSVDTSVCQQSDPPGDGVASPRGVPVSQWATALPQTVSRTTPPRAHQLSGSTSHASLKLPTSHYSPLLPSSAAYSESPPPPVQQHAALFADPSSPVPPAAYKHRDAVEGGMAHTSMRSDGPQPEKAPRFSLSTVTGGSAPPSYKRHPGVAAVNYAATLSSSMKEQAKQSISSSLDQAGSEASQYAL